MSEELPPLPDDIAQALATERSRPPLSAHAHRHLEARITAALPTVAPAVPVATAVATAASTSKVTAALLAGVLTGAVGAGTTVSLLTKQPVPEPVVIEKVVVKEVIKEVVKEVRVEVPVPAKPPVKLPATPSDDEKLAAERALVEAARVALTRGQTAEAVTLLERHVREFKSGRLAEERESLFIQALLALGRTDDARVRAAQFRKAYPESLLRPLIDSLVP